jgi:hypothetical protein
VCPFLPMIDNAWAARRFVMVRRRFALLVMLCALAQRQAGAQDSSRVDDLRPGVRVRFRAPAVAPDRFLGTRRWLTPDSIAIDAPDHRVVTVPRSPITTMEISLGASRMRGAGRGLMWSVPIGAALGAIVTSKLRQPIAFPDDPCACKGETTRRTVIINLTIISAVLGGGFGAANPSERWRSVPVPTEPQPAPR